MDEQRRVNLFCKDEGRQVEKTFEDIWVQNKRDMSINLLCLFSSLSAFIFFSYRQSRTQKAGTVKPYSLGAHMNRPM